MKYLFGKAIFGKNSKILNLLQLSIEFFCNNFFKVENGIYVTKVLLLFSKDNKILWMPFQEKNDGKVNGKISQYFLFNNESNGTK